MTTGSGADFLLLCVISRTMPPTKVRMKRNAASLYSSFPDDMQNKKNHGGYSYAGMPQAQGQRATVIAHTHEDK